MASLSRVNVQVGFQGQQAVDGFKQVEGSARKTAGQVSELSKQAEASGKSAGASAFSWTEFKSKIDLVGGGLKKLAGAVESFASLGAQMQTMQTKLAYSTGSWEKAGKVLEQARQQSMETGASLESLTNGIQKLTAAGISAQGAGDLLSGVARAAELAGGGSQGIQAVTGAMGSLLQAGTATEGALQQLQDSGLDVFGSLGQELTNLTGKAYTTEEALRAIRRGAVSSAMAIQAIEAAGNTPKAVDAAQRFFGSFEGQVARFKATMEDTMREISKLFLEAFDWTALTASARGAFGAIRDIAKEISDRFLPLVDPKNKASGIETSFRMARDFTYEIAERLGKAFENMRTIFEMVGRKMESLLWKASEIAKGGVGGLVSGKSTRGFYWEDQLVKTDMQEIEAQGAKRLAGVEKFFGELRQKADQRDKEQNRRMQFKDLVNLEGAFQTVVDGARSLFDSVKKAASRMEIARKGFEQMALDLEEGFATPAEKFQKAMEDVGAQLKEARARLGAGDLLQRVEGGLKRKAGAQVMDLLKENSVGTSWQASRADKGSAAAMEAILRNRFGEQGQGVQERIKGALDLANRLAKAQLEAQERAIQAFQNAKPGVVAFK